MIFNLRHALQKLTSQHRNLDCLIRFAHSPRLLCALQCRLFMLCVPPPHSRVFTLPHNINDWEYVSKSIVTPSESVAGKWREREANCLVERYTGRETTAAPVHCECSLVDYFTQGSTIATSQTRNPTRSNGGKTENTVGHCKLQPRLLRNQEQPLEIGGRTGPSSKTASVREAWQGVPPFSYIGVSKLSCSRCQIWFEGYNKQQGPKFYTRGSHGKWYWPWGISQLDEEVLSMYMVGRISSIYYEHCRARQRVRRNSDGSNAAINDIERLTDQQDEDFVATLLVRSEV